MAKKGRTMEKLLLKKCLKVGDDEEPIVSEYLELAGVFATAGVHVRRLSERRRRRCSRRLRWGGIQSTLKGAVDRLRVLAGRMSSLEQGNRSLVRQLHDAEVEVKELKRSRSEDAKANEKVMAIFSTQEQKWKNERSNLVRLLKADTCVECLRRKDAALVSAVKQREFLIVAAAEESTVQEQERSEWAQKLSAAEAMLEEMRRQSSEERRELLDRLQNTEAELEEAKEKIILAEMKSLELEEMNSKLVDQEQVISTLGRRNVELRSRGKYSKSLSLDYQSVPNGTDLQKQQVDMSSVYLHQISELEKQVFYYRKKVTELEKSFLGSLNDDEQPQLAIAQNLLAQLIEAENRREVELGRWRKLYMATKVALEMVQARSNEYSGLSSAMKQNLEIAKAQQASEMAERHLHEMGSFERLLKAKDERIEALRTHLGRFEKDLAAKEYEVEELRSRLAETQETLRRTQEETQNSMITRLEMKMDEEQIYHNKIITGVLEEDREDNPPIVACLKLPERIYEATPPMNKLEQQCTNVLLEQAANVSLPVKNIQNTKVLRADSSKRLETSPDSQTAVKQIPILGCKGEVPPVYATLKKQLRKYQFLLQKMNSLSEEADRSHNGRGSLLSSVIQLKKQVDASGRKLALIQAQEAEGEEYPRALSEHLKEIQKRLELKIRNMINVEVPKKAS